jgi:peroxin-2
VDAELLDEELLELLKGQVGEALKYFGSHIQDEWSAEIMLALRAVLFKLSVWDHGIYIDRHPFSTSEVLIEV